MSATATVHDVALQVRVDVVILHFPPKYYLCHSLLHNGVHFADYFHASNTKKIVSATATVHDQVRVIDVVILHFTPKYYYLCYLLLMVYISQIIFMPRAQKNSVCNCDCARCSTPGAC